MRGTQPLASVNRPWAPIILGARPSEPPLIGCLVVVARQGRFVLAKSLPNRHLWNIVKISDFGRYREHLQNQKKAFFHHNPEPKSIVRQQPPDMGVARGGEANHGPKSDTLSGVTHFPSLHPSRVLAAPRKSEGLPFAGV